MNAPAPFLRDFLISALQLGMESELNTTQIRAQLDVSGTPRGTEGVIVAVTDQGGHDGLPGRILVDCSVSVQIFTHLDEDTDGTRLDILQALALGILSNIEYPLLPGWKVQFPGIWQVTPPEIMDSVFRSVTLTATVFLQHLI